MFTVLLGDDSVPRLCELANGAVIAPDRSSPISASAEMETILFDGPFTVIAASPPAASRADFVGRSKSATATANTPPAATSRRRDCDVDHIVPFPDGGETSQFNGRLECRPHNRDATKHDHGAIPHPKRPVTTSTSSAPACAGATSTRTARKHQRPDESGKPRDLVPWEMLRLVRGFT